MSTTLKVGDRFPVERLTPRPDGAAVVYFYPRDLTPGCTLQAKRFNDLYDRFRDLGFEVIGVSMDARESHDEFTRECSLRFPLATDEGGALTRDLGILQSHEQFGEMPRRVTFLLDGDATVRRIWEVEPGLETAEANPDEVLAEAGA